MWGAIIGAGLSLASNLFGQSAASDAASSARSNMRKANAARLKGLEAAQSGMRDELKWNDDWYNRRSNEDYTQRADAQRLLTHTLEQLRSRSRQAAGRQAVMGGTEESLAATKEANSAAMAEAAGRIAAGASQHKDAVEGEYLGRRRQMSDALNNSRVRVGEAQAEGYEREAGLDQARAEEIRKSAGATGDALGSLGSAVADVIGI